MPEQPGFAQVQYAFAAHIRDPARRPRPADVEERRMAIYRDLFYNNLESLLAGNFPVLRRLLPDAHWHAMVRDFFVRHRCETPYFLELAQEFLDYLQNERAADAADPPFLLELAHYEWVELALAIAEEDPDPAAADPNGDLLAGRPLVSPLAWALTYRFPVHRIGPDCRPEAPEGPPTHLVVYRNRADDVEFMEINAVTQRLLELVREHPDWTGRDAVQCIAGELKHPDPGQVLRAGAELLAGLRRRDILLGTRRAPA
jgi:hypothetical protein